jgi:hypothetical protein
MEPPEAKVLCAGLGEGASVGEGLTVEVAVASGGGVLLADGEAWPLPQPAPATNSRHASEAKRAREQGRLWLDPRIRFLFCLPMTAASRAQRCSGVARARSAD